MGKKLSFEKFVNDNGNEFIDVTNTPCQSIDFDLVGEITLSYDYSLYRSCVIMRGTTPMLHVLFGQDLIILQGYVLDPIFEALKTKTLKRVAEAPGIVDALKQEEPIVTKIHVEKTWLHTAMKSSLEDDDDIDALLPKV